MFAILALALCALGSGAPAAFAAPPVVTIDPASQVGVTSAKATGAVNPKGKEANYRFDYISDAAYSVHQDEQQRLTVAATAGTYTLSFGGQTTNPIAFDASAGTVQSELEALSSIGAGNLAASGGPGDEAGTAPYTLSFEGSLGDTNVEQVSSDPSALTGGSQSANPETILEGRAEGFEGAAQAGFGATPTEPEAILEGLQPATTYHLRLVAENADSAGVPSIAVAPNFTTDPVTVPTLAIDPPADVKYTTVHVSGSIDPEGGNLNPANGGAIPIGWELQVDREGSGWEGRAGGTIEGSEAASSTPIAIPVDLSSLQNGATYKFRLRAVYAGGLEALSPEGEFQTLAVTAPTVAIDPVTTFTATTAHLSGQVGPNAPGAAPQDPAFDTTWHFLCTPECPGISGKTILADDQSHEVSVDATGLKPGVHYEVSLIAENLNAAGPVTAGPVSFDTPVIAPEVQTGSANVSADSAALSGSVDPKGGETNYRFDYGTSSLDQSTPTQSLAASNEVKGVGANLTGLAANTTYRYQLIATNSAGEVKGAERTFTTAAVASGENCPNAAVREQQGSTYLPECRAYELVNSPSINLGDTNRVPKISDDGEYAATMSLVPNEESLGGALVSISVAHRTPSGWVRSSADPFAVGSALSPEQRVPSISAPVTFSKDFSQAMIGTNLRLVSDPEGTFDRYFRITVGTGLGPRIERGDNARPIAATPDLGKVMFQGLNNGFYDVYINNGSGFEEVLSHAPKLIRSGAYQRGLGVGDGASGDSYPWIERGGVHAVSDDLRRIYFYSVEAETGTPAALSLRDLSGPVAETIPVGASQRAGEVGTMRGAAFVSASHDGSTAYFASDFQLTEDAAPGGGIYRFDLATRDLTLLTPDPGDPSGLHLSGAIASDDQSHIYFTSTSDLGGAAVAGENNAYVWTQAEGTRFIARVGGQGLFERVTPDGRYALMTSSASIEGAPNNGFQAIYEYDYESGELACVSCRPDGSPSQSGAELQAEPPGFPKGAFTHGRALAFDGRVFFDSTDRLVSRDQTSAQDIYVYDKGKVSLLSSGREETASYVAENSDDGKHVFIYTRASLVGADRDAQEFDVYDVSLGGGFLEAPPPPAPCRGEACRTAPSSPPPSAAPTTANLIGPEKPKSCAKGKVRRNARCVKPRKGKKKNASQKKNGSQKRAANTNGRTGR